MSPGNSSAVPSQKIARKKSPSRCGVFTKATLERKIKNEPLKKDQKPSPLDANEPRCNHVVKKYFIIVSIMKYLSVVRKN